MGRASELSPKDWKYLPKKTGKRVKFLSQIIAAFVNNPPWIRATHEEE